MKGPRNQFSNSDLIVFTIPKISAAPGPFSLPPLPRVGVRRMCGFQFSVLIPLPPYSEEEEEDEAELTLFTKYSLCPFCRPCSSAPAPPLKALNNATKLADSFCLLSHENRSLHYSRRACLALNSSQKSRKLSLVTRGFPWR